MLKRILWLLLLAAPVAAHAQTAAIPVYWCSLPGTQATVSGLKSTNYQLGVIPSCLVTVYLTGTTTIATTTPQSPFTANTNGSIPPIFAAINQGYDVVLSGGIPPNTYPAPITLTGLYPGFEFTGGGGVSGLNTLTGSVGITSPDSSIGVGASGNNVTLSVNGKNILPTSVVSSVNLEINVMASPYNAKGDCLADDHDAITAAMVAANAFNPPLTVVFPNPPGHCYLTSTLTWLGVTLLGRPGIGVNPPEGNTGVIIKGKPGQDVFRAPDPTTVSTAAPRVSWSIRDIVFEVDDSVDAHASFPHRWPGRWVQDAGMNAASAVITSPHAYFECGDVGQAILVKGAGPGGSDLSTTIASIIPCISAPNGQAPGTVVTLAAVASTTVTAGTGTAYISVAGLPVTATVGNAALAFDCKDGNSAHYTMTGSISNNADELTNAKFYGLSNAFQNSSAGIFMQSCWSPYGMVLNNVTINGTYFGAVFTGAELNSYLANDGGLADFFSWRNGTLEAAYPWISYDGGLGTIEGVQIFSGSGYGPQLVNATTPEGDYVNNWYFNMPEIETLSGTYPGWRLSGGNHVGVNLYLGGLGYSTVGPILDASDSTCTSCGAGGTFKVSGSRNRITLTSLIDLTPGASTPIVQDTGNGNQIMLIGNAGSPFHGQPASRRGTAVKQVLDQPAGIQTSDFVRSGNLSTPYPNDNDLVFTPKDIGYGSGILDEAHVFADSSALFGNYYAWPNGTTDGAFFSLYTQNKYGQAFIGTQIPAVKAIIYVAVKCPTATSFTFTPGVSGPIFLTPVTSSCSSSSYTVASVVADFSSYTGLAFIPTITTASNDARVAYIAIRPYQHDYNGSQPMLAGIAKTSDLSDLTDAGASVNYVLTCTHVTGGACDAWGPAAAPGGSIPGGLLGSVPYQSAPNTTALVAPNTSSSTLCLTETGTGSVGAAPTWGSCAGSSATAFSALTGSTNTSAAMVVGSGASLDFTGTGIIDANEMNGATVPASAAALASNASHQIIAAHVADASNNGYLSSSDWTTFNGKQNALTNPVTGPGSGATVGHLAVMGNIAGTSITDGGAVPSVGTWGALNYPAWSSGTPFVKMTAAGTFALDTNTYLTSSGVSGMTTGQIPVAASATTITSSKALQGTDSSILTSGTVSGTGVSLCTDANGGATTSGCSGSGTTTNALTVDNSGTGDASGFTFNGSAAKKISYNSIGAAPALAACSIESSTFTPANGTCYFVTASVSTATPSASAFVIFTATTSSGGQLALTGTTIADGGGCSSYILGTTLTLPASQSISVKSDNTNIRASCTVASAPASGIALSALATQAADTVDMNATAGSASPTAVAMPTCTSGADLYNTSTHSWSCTAVGGSGTVTVVGAGSLTSTALVTGGGSQALQTPSAASTLDASGNATFAGQVIGTAGIFGTPSTAAKAALPSGAHGMANDESATAGVPAASICYLRADSTSHTYEESCNNAAESPLATQGWVGTVSNLPTITIAKGGTNATSAAAGQVPNSTSGTASSWTSTITLGAAGTLGSITFGNATSGTLTLQPVTGAISGTALIPSGGGTLAFLTGTTHGLKISQGTSSAETTVAVCGTNLPIVGVTSGDPICSKVTLTQPATGSTLTIIDGKTLTATNTMDVAKQAGVAGGIPWYDTTTSQSASALLTQYGVMVGGGASAAPATISVPAADALLYGTTGANPIFKALPTSGTNGCAGTTDMLQWNNSTHAFGCGTAGAGGGGSITGYGTLVAYDVYYMPSGGSLATALADASINLATNPALCVASSTSVCQTAGSTVTNGSWTWTVGGALYVSDGTTGTMTQTKPTTSTHYIQRVGIALSATTILVMPGDVGTVQ